MTGLGKPPRPIYLQLIVIRLAQLNKIWSPQMGHDKLELWLFFSPDQSDFLLWRANLEAAVTLCIFAFN